MTATEQIDQFIADLPDWKRQLALKTRKLIREVDPEITEEWKWGVPVWAHNGMICAFGSFKDAIKINFFKGASLTDPDKLFNTGLEAKATRAIDVHETDKFDEDKLKKLLRSAVDFNLQK